MRNLFVAAILVIASGVGTKVLAGDPPGWAYGFPPAGTPAAPAAATLRPVKWVVGRGVGPGSFLTDTAAR